MMLLNPYRFASTGGGPPPSGDASFATQVFDTAATAHNVTMPAAVAAGDILVVAIYNTGATLSSSQVATPSGWTAMSTLRSTFRLTLYRKAADGTEGGTTVNFATASEATRMTAIVMRFPATAFQGTPEVMVNSGSGATLQPPDISPTWSTASPTFFAIGFGAPVDTNGLSVSAYPYASNNLLASCTFAGSNVPGMAACTTTATTATLTPGTFTKNTANVSVRFTLAVRML